MIAIRARLRDYMPHADGRANPWQWWAFEASDSPFPEHGPFTTRRELEVAMAELAFSSYGKPLMLDAYVPEKRVYTDSTWSTDCEHCDKVAPSRLDYLRGYICRDCDSALDEMLNERSR